MNIKSLPLLVLISSGLLNAQVVPGRWEKVDLLQPGQEIFITFKSGGVINYTFKSSDSTRLIVNRSGSIETDIPKADVTKVVRLKSPSNKAAWIGAGVGAAAVAVPIAAAFCSADGCSGDASIVYATVTLSALAALTGYFIGKAVADVLPSDEVLYQAP